MRNLKKILALALALIMSLSLMATASAAKTEFGDQESINEKYELAIEVLNQLGVLKGDDRDGDGKNEFRPADTITRGEVAAIIYRVFTGKTDVETDGHGIYTAANGEFADVKGHWSEGYMVYCYQGGYIKGWPGVGGVVLNPGGDITGYEVLTMILRAVGYDKKENEFTGLNWKLNVATTATERGVLANYQGTDLGAAATREEVAELIFRAILLPKVEYSLVTNSYTILGENNTIAASPLNMKKITGVVVANEWANIKEGGTTVIGVGKTDLLLADGNTTRLNIGSDITDIGESRFAYVQNESTVLGSLENTGKNVIKDSGVDNNGLASSVAGLWSGSATGARFNNFGDTSMNVSAYRLEYSISFKDADALALFQTKYLGYDLSDARITDNKKADRNDLNELKDSTAGSYYLISNKAPETEAEFALRQYGRTFTRSIPAGEEITPLDQDIMENIFKIAGSFDADHPTFKELTDARVSSTIVGYVYAGTNTAPSKVDKAIDLSNEMTYAEFKDEYISGKDTTTVTGSTNGGWLKIVDNNGDGNAEYVFLTRYHLAEIVDYNTRTGLFVYSDGLNTDTKNNGLTPKYRDGYTPEVGDFVLWAPIDGQAVIQPAVSENAVFEKYDWREETITTTGGEKTYYQSEANVTNGTEYEDDISKAEYGVEYQLFLDQYGHIRAYRPVDNTKNYALLTELYLTGSKNHEHITGTDATVELWYRDENGNTPGDEYGVANYGRNLANPFVGTSLMGWEQDAKKTHELQRAMAHLDLGVITSSWSKDVTWGYAPTGSVDGTSTDEDGVIKVDASTPTTDVYDYEFDYSGLTGNHTTKFSYTNVAKYRMNDDGTVDIYSAAEYATDKGEQLFYWYDSTTSDYATWKTYAEASARGADKMNLKIGGTRLTEQEWYNAYSAWYKDQNSGAVEADVRTNTRTALANCLYPVYAVDYVQLAKNGSIDSTTYRYKVHANYGSYNAVTNDHVDAVKDTLFFVVTPTKVYSYVGYSSLPNIPESKIRSMYAVAQTATNNGTLEDYWVADVIVIETDSLALYNHMILNYNDNFKVGNRAEIHNLDAIDCTTGEMIKVTVDERWGTRIPAGFYVLVDPEIDDNGDIYTTGARNITELFNDENGATTVAQTEYNDYNIFAGQLQRSVVINGKRDDFIEVWETWDAIAADTAAGAEKDENTEREDAVTVPWYSIYAGSDADQTAKIFDCVRLEAADYNGIIPNGNELIWVTDNNGDILFVVDTTFRSPTYRPVNWQPALFLNDGANAQSANNASGYLDRLDDDIYNAVMDEQTYRVRNAVVDGPLDGLWSITFQYADDNEVEYTLPTGPIYFPENTTSWTINYTAPAATTGVQATAMTVISGATLGALTDVSNTWTVSGITGDVVIAVKFTATTKDVHVANNVINQNGVTKVHAASTANTTGVDLAYSDGGSGDTVLAGVKYGDTVTITITGTNTSNKVYTVTTTPVIASLKATSDDNKTWTFTMPAQDVTVTVAETAVTVPVSITLDADSPYLDKITGVTINGTSLTRTGNSTTITGEVPIGSATEAVTVNCADGYEAAASYTIKTDDTETTGTLTGVKAKPTEYTITIANTGKKAVWYVGTDGSKNVLEDGKTFTWTIDKPLVLASKATFSVKTLKETASPNGDVGTIGGLQIDEDDNYSISITGINKASTLTIDPS